MRKWLWAIIILSIVGLAVASYSFFHNQGLASGEFCAIGDTFDCDVVNKGPYSKIFGIPVSLIGIVGYAFLGAAAYLKMRDLKDGLTTMFLLGSAAVGFGFTLYLTSLEAFVLETWCLLCLTSQAIMALIFFAVLGLWYTERKQKKNLVEKITSHFE